MGRRPGSSVSLSANNIVAVPHLAALVKGLLHLWLANGTLAQLDRSGGQSPQGERYPSSIEYADVLLLQE